MSYGVSYSGVEGLTLNYGIGDSGTQTAEVEHTTISGSYALWTSNSFSFTELRLTMLVLLLI